MYACTRIYILNLNYCTNHHACQIESAFNCHTASGLHHTTESHATLIHHHMHRSIITRWHSEQQPICDGCNGCELKSSFKIGIVLNTKSGSSTIVPVGDEEEATKSHHGNAL
jgi:hypothetical protein